MGIYINIYGVCRKWFCIIIQHTSVTKSLHVPHRVQMAGHNGTYGCLHASRSRAQSLGGTTSSLNPTLDGRRCFAMSPKGVTSSRYSKATRSDQDWRLTFRLRYIVNAILHKFH